MRTSFLVSFLIFLGSDQRIIAASVVFCIPDSHPNNKNTHTHKLGIVNQINLLASTWGIQCSFNPELEVPFHVISNSIWNYLHMVNLLGICFSGNLLGTLFSSPNMKGSQTMETTLHWSRSEIWSTLYTCSAVSFNAFPAVWKTWNNNNIFLFCFYG